MRIMDGRNVDQKRLIWVDLVKSAAIVLVVFGHSWRGIHDAGLMTGDLFLAVDRFVYSFHMPLFFIISGYLFRRACDRPWKTVLGNQWLGIIWPYVLWSIILIAAKNTVASEVNSTVSLTEILKIPYSPYAVFWFLYVLVALQLAAKLLRDKTGLSSFWFLITGFILSGAGFLVPFDFFPAAELILKFAAFFAAGFYCADKNLPGNWRVRGGQAILALAGFFAVQYALFLGGAGPETPLYFMAGLFLSACVITGFMWLADRQFAHAAIFSFISSRTLAIYVAHVLFTAATRIVLMKAGVDLLPVHVFTGTLAGIIGPLIIYELCARYGFTAQAGFGRDMRSPQKPGIRASVRLSRT
jgi:fucose 4-O-acetylase-like acetyltransferase